MHNSFLLTGIKYIYWIRSYVTNTWVCLGVFLILIYELWLFQVPGSRARSFFLGSGFFAEANSTLVAGRGPVGLWGCGAGGRGDEGTSWSQKLWGLDRSNRVFASIQKLPGFRWRIHGLTLPKFGYKTQTPAEVGIWRCGSGDFEGDFVGFELEPSRQWATWGELKSCYLWMMYIFPCFLELAPESCR